MSGGATEDMRRPATLVHASDVHIDRPGDRPEQRAFQAIVDLAVDRDAEVLLIAGDLFEHNRIGPELIDWVGGQLNRFAGTTALLVGNHDNYADYSVYRRHDLRDVCERLVMFDDPLGTSFDIPGTDITVWGKAMIEHAPEFRPVENAPAAREERWNVIAAHGHVEAEPGRSSPILLSELAGLTADYVALGHVHDWTIIQAQPLTMYSGSPYRPGTDKSGCVVVEFETGAGTQASWVPLIYQM